MQFHSGHLPGNTTAVDNSLLMQAIETVPPGRWGIGVSGGADSVALLQLMHRRPDIELHVIHLDHQTRDGHSAADAAFVTCLSSELKLPCTIQLRSQVEAPEHAQIKNRSTRYRKARFALFHSITQSQRLQGVLLAHHQDDQAETILMRVLRGASADRLGGIRTKSTVGGLVLNRPLLNIPATALRQFLQQTRQPWREDSSNDSNQYQRNRVRAWLKNHPSLRDDLLRLHTASETLNDWLEAAAPRLGRSFDVNELNQIVSPLARRSAGRWLLDHGAPPKLINTRVCNQLLAMALDAASPPRQTLPGGLQIRRSRKTISLLK